MQRMKLTVAFLMGMLAAMLVLRLTAPADAQQPVVAFGSNSGTLVAVAVDSSGNLLTAGQ